MKLRCGKFRFQKLHLKLYHLSKRRQKPVSAVNKVFGNTKVQTMRQDSMAIRRQTNKQKH